MVLGQGGRFQSVCFPYHACCSVTQSCHSLYDPMDCNMPPFPVLHHLPEFSQTHVIESVMPSNPLIFCCPLLFSPSVILSIRVFSSESALSIRWPKYWSFSFSISPSNEFPGLIYFRIDWFDLFVVQGTLKCLLQHHSSKASILWHLAFLVQLSHPFMTTAKTFIPNIHNFLLFFIKRLLPRFLSVGATKETPPQTKDTFRLKF